MKNTPTRTRTQVLEIDTTEYERAHGSAPRRAAYGTWLLRIDGATIELTGEWLRARRELAAQTSGTAYLLP